MPVLLRIPMPRRGDGNYGIHVALPTILTSRQEQSPRPNLRRHDDDGGGSSTILIAIVVVLAVITLVVGSVVFIKCRRKRQAKYQRASNLEPYGSTTPGSSSRRLSPGSANAVSETNRNSATSNVDRNTSIRSIMTLPKYTNTANEGEQVIGRGGERGGVDIIVEMPSPTTQEALRDEEMETMYQIRLARRQQNADREDRRRLTQEARERGDTAALEELRARRRAEYDDTTVDELREAQIQIRTRRERAVSSVSYHDLGVARHDGSRIRANSTESERVGLLSDAASIAQSTRSPSAMSTRRISDTTALVPDARSPSAHSQHRLRSVSVLSLDENGEVSPPGAATPRAASSHTRAGSSPEIVTEADLGDSHMPPPDYEELSLDDGRPGATTPVPFHEPPPGYSQRNNGDGDTGDLAAPADAERTQRRSSHRSSRGLGGVPRLPSLRIRELPQIVIEPSITDAGDFGR
ncbi:hypothetical protein F4861DRAFT_484838 [Xylaria intraflava]|nr:hypothetical protein F4861DRAFT_484838 [Xylaria intraflava]